MTSEQQEKVAADVAALMGAHTKPEIVKLAREAGFRGDDARTSKEALCEFVARSKAGVEQRQEGGGETSGSTGTGEQGSGSVAGVKPDASGMRAMAARFPGKCAHCSEPIAAGEQIAYDKPARKAYHVRCITGLIGSARQNDDAPKAAGDAVAAVTVAASTVAGVVADGAQRAQQNQANIAAAIAAALGSVKLGVDPEEVRVAVKAEMAGVADMLRTEISQSVYRVEVKGPTGAVVDVGRQHMSFSKLVRYVGCGLHVWLTGPAGSGKTTAAEACAKALGLPFSFDGALDTEYKVIGFIDAQGRIVSTAFRKAYIEGGLHLQDECDGSSANATLALNAALANGFASFPDGMHKMHPNFRCIAAANTWGDGATFDYVGRNKLDKAFLDRFVRLVWNYDETFERDIAIGHGATGAWVSYVQQARSKVFAKGLKVVISPRASIFGGRMIAAGIPMDEIVDATLRVGMRKEDWAALGMGGI